MSSLAQIAYRKTYRNIPPQLRAVEKSILGRIPRLSSQRYSSDVILKENLDRMKCDQLDWRTLDGMMHLNTGLIDVRYIWCFIKLRLQVKIYAFNILKYDFLDLPASVHDHNFTLNLRIKRKNAGYVWFDYTVVDNRTGRVYKYKYPVENNEALSILYKLRITDYIDEDSIDYPEQMTDHDGTYLALTTKISQLFYDYPIESEPDY